MIDNKDKREFTWEDLKALVRSWILEKDREQDNGDSNPSEKQDSSYGFSSLDGFGSRISLVYPSQVPRK